MLIINFEGREAKGLSKGRYDETFAGEDDFNLTKTLTCRYGPCKVISVWSLFCLGRNHRIYKSVMSVRVG